MTKGQDKPEVKAEQPPAGGRFSTVVMLGTNIAVGMGLFTLLGLYIDSRRGGGVSFTVAGAFLGFVYAGYELWRTIMMLQRDDMAETKAQRDPEK